MGFKQLGIQTKVGTSFADILYDNARNHILALSGIDPYATRCIAKIYTIWSAIGYCR